MDADLEWQANSTLSIGPWPVRISDDATHAQLHDLDTLEDLREIHGWDPFFTLRFPDGTTHDVAVARPDDDGTFLLIDIDAAAALEAAATHEGTNDLLPEPEQIADTTAWLHQHGFTTREHSRGGRLSGSRLFKRGDGWRARYSCVLGTWSLELSPPGQHRFTSFHHLWPDQATPWHEVLPNLIGDPPQTSTNSDSKE
ncbi:hypothetical protein [Krasilnikovia sp. MM14-A1259]|uniref:hypothetical protein n=1 Tax=Krasilnikovia sp. MM14-A1259 TaxID=3373539 RepID=UPI00399C9FD0